MESEVKRYAPEQDREDWGEPHTMAEDPNGEWVRHADLIAMQFERDELRYASRQWMNQFHALRDQVTAERELFAATKADYLTEQRRAEEAEESHKYFVELASKHRDELDAQVADLTAQLQMMREALRKIADCEAFKQDSNGTCISDARSVAYAALTDSAPRIEEQPK